MLIRRHKEKEKVEVKEDLSSKTVTELKDKAKEKGLEGYSNMKKEELIELIEGA